MTKNSNLVVEFSFDCPYIVRPLPSGRIVPVVLLDIDASASASLNESTLRTRCVKIVRVGTVVSLLSFLLRKLLINALQLKISSTLIV